MNKKKHLFTPNCISYYFHVVNESPLTLKLLQRSPSSRVLCLLASLQGIYLCNEFKKSCQHTTRETNQQGHQLFKLYGYMNKTTYVPLCRSYSLLPLRLKLSGFLVYPPPPLAPLLPLIPPLPRRLDSAL